MVICLELGADLHMAQLMPLPLTVSCFTKILIGFSFLVPAHPGSPGKRAIKQVYVCSIIYSSCKNISNIENLTKVTEKGLIPLYWVLTLCLRKTEVRCHLDTVSNANNDNLQTPTKCKL